MCYPNLESNTQNIKQIFPVSGCQSIWDLRVGSGGYFDSTGKDTLSAETYVCDIRS